MGPARLVPPNLANEFFEINRRWTPEEYSGIEVPILSIQAEFEGFFEANLTAKGSPLMMLETARVWSRELDAVLKRRRREMLAAAIPAAVQEEFEATHHWLHLQHTERVARRMMKFFDSYQLQ